MGIRKYTLKSGEVRYQANVWRKNKRVLTQSFRRKADAVEFLRNQELKYINEDVGRPKGLAMSYNDFFHQVYRSRTTVKVGTLNDYESIQRTHVSPGMGLKNISELDSNAWSQFFASLLAKGVSEARINRVHTKVSSVYTLAIELNYVVTNPVRTLPWYRESPKRLDYLSKDELAKFLSHTETCGSRLAILYQTAYETGMRIGEVIGLKRDCIDLDSNTITICRTYSKDTRMVENTTKNGHQRAVGLNPGLKSKLTNLLKLHESEFVFCDRNGKHLLYEYVKKAMDRDLKKSGIRRITPHTLRHTYASHFVMNGGNIYDLKELLGHANVETTMRYAHLAKSHLTSKAALVSFGSQST